MPLADADFGILSSPSNSSAGDPRPSRADIEMTQEVAEAGRALRIAVHDHLVVGRDGVASFKGLRLM